MGRSKERGAGLKKRAIGRGVGGDVEVCKGGQEEREQHHNDMRWGGCREVQRWVWDGGGWGEGRERGAVV